MKNILIISLLVIISIIISCNIFDWTSDLNLNDPYDLVRAGETALNEGELVKAQEYFSKAIKLFEENPLDDSDSDYLYFMLYYSKAYRGLGTAHLQEALPLELILDMVERFSDTAARENSTSPNILDYLLTNPDDPADPGPEERIEIMNRIFTKILARYQSNFDSNEDGISDYYYDLDEIQKDNDIINQRGAAADRFEKAEIISHIGFLKGVEMDENDELTNDQKKALDRLREASTNTAFDTVLGLSLSTILLTLDSSFDFQVKIPETPLDRIDGDYFTILPNFEYHSYLEEEFEQLIGDGTVGLTSIDPATLTEEEILEYIEDIDDLLELVKQVKKFANSLYQSIEKLVDVFDRFLEKIDKLDLTSEQQDLLQEYIEIFIDRDNKDCDPMDDTLYCEVRSIYYEIDQTSTAAVVLLATLKLALIVGTIDLDNFGDLGDFLDDEDAQTIIDLLTDPECFDASGNVDFSNGDCQIGLGSEGDLVPDGAFTDTETEMNEIMNVTDTIDIDGITLPGEPDGSSMSPNKKWKALLIVSTCSLNPLEDECRFLDDMD